MIPLLVLRAVGPVQLTEGQVLGLEFLYTLWGCLYREVSPAPPPPRRNKANSAVSQVSHGFLQTILRQCNSRFRAVYRGGASNRVRHPTRTQIVYDCARLCVGTLFQSDGLVQFCPTPFVASSRKSGWRNTGRFFFQRRGHLWINSWISNCGAFL